MRKVFDVFKLVRKNIKDENIRFTMFSLFKIIEKVNILNIQNITLFGIGLYSTYCYLNYYLHTGETSNSFIRSTDSLPNAQNASNYIKPFDNLFFFIRIHAGVDIFFVRTIDVKLHHLCILGIYFYNWCITSTAIDRFIFSSALFKAEISSIFLVLTYWLPENTYAYKVNSLLFYATFWKFRIFDMYNELIKDNCAFDIVINTHTPSSPLNIVLYVSIYGLYTLNVYWFLLLTKILYEKISSNHLPP